MKITRTATSPEGVKEDGLALFLTVSEAKRIRAALSELADEDLDSSYGGILETLRKCLPQQFGR